MYLQTYHREQEGEVDGGDEPVCSGSGVAAVVAVHVARPLAAEAVEQAQDVADQDQENEARHSEADVVPETIRCDLSVSLTPFHESVLSVSMRGLIS